MKKLCFYLGLLMLPFVTKAQDNGESTSKVYFYRLPNFIGSGIKMDLFANDKPIVRLANNSVYQLNIKPGVYRFSSKMVDSSALKLKIDSGKSYYIKCYLTRGFWSGIPVLEMVDSISGDAVISGGSLKRQDYKPISMIKPKSRIGIFIGGGSGFEDIPMGATDTGDKLTLSTGGGISLGAEFGYEFYRYLDLSLNWFYQSSSLSPKINNGDAFYDRMGIIVTPALIIPIKGDYLRFKLGGGLGLYSLGTITLNASKAGGDVYKLNYEPSIGLHSSLIFESYFSNRGSFSLGLKYYNIQYKYTKEGSTGITESKVLNPNGSGLDFVVGYYYHF